MGRRRTRPGRRRRHERQRAGTRSPTDPPFTLVKRAVHLARVGWGVVGASLPAASPEEGDDGRTDARGETTGPGAARRVGTGHRRPGPRRPATAGGDHLRGGRGPDRRPVRRPPPAARALPPGRHRGRLGDRRAARAEPLLGGGARRLGRRGDRPPPGGPARPPGLRPAPDGGAVLAGRPPPGLCAVLGPALARSGTRPAQSPRPGAPGASHGDTTRDTTGDTTRGTRKGV
jgi:hypothetical protein